MGRDFIAIKLSNKMKRSKYPNRSKCTMDRVHITDHIKIQVTLSIINLFYTAFNLVTGTDVAKSRQCHNEDLG